MTDPPPESVADEQAGRSSFTLSHSAATLLERQQRILFSYHFIQSGKGRSGHRRWPWATWALALLTGCFWVMSAYWTALREGRADWPGIVSSIWSTGEDPQVLIAVGAKYTPGLRAGEYWRLLTPIFLHANLGMLILSLLTLFALGWWVERIFGPLRFVIIYLLAGMSGVVASLLGLPQGLSVGASGALFGLAGAYGAFLFLHRRASSWLEPLCLALIVVLNLGLGLLFAGTDIWAHTGGLLGGYLAGYLLCPFYIQESAGQRETGILQVRDEHNLRRRWPLALLMFALLLVSATIALYIVGG